MDTKFQTFRCDCGYVCISPEEKPKCSDCGKSMKLVTDESKKAEIDQMIKPIIWGIATKKVIAKNKMKVIILDNNPLSIASYLEEFGDKEA